MKNKKIIKGERTLCVTSTHDFQGGIQVGEKSVEMTSCNVIQGRIMNYWAELKFTSIYIYTHTISHSFFK